MIERLVKQFASGGLTVYQLWDRIDKILACQESLRFKSKSGCCHLLDPCPIGFQNHMSIEKVSAGI